MHQKTAACRLDHQSKYRLYLDMFFDLKDVTNVNSHTASMKLGNDISLLNFKIVAVKAVIGRYSNRYRSFFTSRSSKGKSHEPSMAREVANCRFEFQ